MRDLGAAFFIATATTIGWLVIDKLTGDTNPYVLIFCVAWGDALAVRS